MTAPIVDFRQLAESGVPAADAWDVIVRRRQRERSGCETSYGRHTSWVFTAAGASNWRHRFVQVCVASVWDMDTAAPSIDDLVDMTGFAARTVRVYVTELCERGLVVWDRAGIRVTAPFPAGEVEA